MRGVGKGEMLWAGMTKMGDNGVVLSSRVQWGGGAFFVAWGVGLLRTQ